MSKHNRNTASSLLGTDLPLDRRALLRAMGFGAGSLALPSLLGRRAEAAGPPPPRIVFLMTMFGTTHREYGLRPAMQRDRNWEMDITGMAADDFLRVLRPLHPFRKKMLAIEGLDMVSAKAEHKYYPDVFHAGGTVNLVTGNMSAASSGQKQGNRDKALSISIDQLIADRVVSSGQLRSIEIASGKQLNGNGAYSFRGAGGGLPAERDPARLWARLFEDFTPPDTAPPPSGPTKPSLQARIKAGRKDVLTFSQDAYKSFATSGRLSEEDRRKLDDHRSFLGDVAKQIGDLDQGGSVVLAGCGKPDRPSGTTTTPTSGADYDRHVDVMMKLTTAALACDRTRVANIVLHTMPSSLFSPDKASNDVHFGWAHNTRATSSDPWGTPKDPDIYEIMTKYHTYHAANHVKKMAELLDGVQEGSGTLLDNTILLWWNEMGHGYHRADPYPAVILGGKNLGIQQGKYMYLPARQHKIASFDEVRPATHHLLVSLAHAMGLKDINSVGLKSIDGVDLSGPLEGVLV